MTTKDSRYQIHYFYQNSYENTNKINGIKKPREPKFKLYEILKSRFLILYICKSKKTEYGIKIPATTRHKTFNYGLSDTNIGNSSSHCSFPSHISHVVYG